MAVVRREAANQRRRLLGDDARGAPVTGTPTGDAMNEAAPGCDVAACSSANMSVTERPYDVACAAPHAASRYARNSVTSRVVIGPGVPALIG